MSKQLDLLAATDDLSTMELTGTVAIDVPDVQAAADGKPIVPRFNMVGYTGGAMRVAGFPRPVVVDLAGVQSADTIPAFRDHDAAQIVGHGEAHISGTDIRMDGLISADNEHSREVITSAKNGFPWQASIGASVDQWEAVKEGQKIEVNGQEIAGPVIVVRKSTLNEISFVPLGADRRTSAKVAASAGNKGSDMQLTKDTTFSEWAAAQDCEVEGLSAKVRAKLEAQFQAEKAQLSAPPPDNPHGKGFLQTLEAEKAEKKRIDAIDRIAMHAIKAYPTQLDTIDEMVRAAHADKTCDPREFELQMLRAMTPVGPSNIVSKRDGEIGGQVIEAAICKTLNLRDIEKHFDERTLTATDKYFRHGMGLQQLLFKAAGANGHHFDSAADIDSLLRAAFGHERQIQATGFSTISLPGIMGNVFNKLLRDQWNAVESTWRQIAAIRSARDFRQFTTYALTGDLKFEKLGADGEIKHGTLGEGEYTNRVETHARMLAITRQDIINDDLGAFERIPRRLGRGGALALNEAFWTEFLDNSAHFAAGNSNVNTGADSALDGTGSAIGAAETVFSALTDPDGNPLGIMPRILLVPPTLLNTAAAVMGGQRIIGGTDAISDANVYQGRYRVVSSVYMENANLTGNSAAAWYLLADPNDLPTIEVAFLNGRQQPTVDRAEADFHQLGIQIRAYFDFGVSLQEPRAGVRSAGS